MAAVLATPVERVESVAGLRFPSETDARLQWLMDANSRGRLTEPSGPSWRRWRR